MKTDPNEITLIQILLFKMFHQHVNSSHITSSPLQLSIGIKEADENCHPNDQIHIGYTMNQIDKMSSMDYLPSNNKSVISENILKDDSGELNILIRRVGMEDHLNIVKLFQVSFKYQRLIHTYLEVQIKFVLLLHIRIKV